MKNNDTRTISSETASLPIVRIDALDELFIQPLREFFAINGCQVFINSSPSLVCTYRIVVGDLQFVKSILDKPTITSQKSMCVIWDIHEDDVHLSTSSTDKIALIDPKIMSAELLGTLCNFFFIGSSRMKNFQTTMPPKRIEERPKQREPEVNEKNGSETEDDKKRIAKTISREFIKPSEPKQKQKKWIPFIIFSLCCLIVIPLLLYVGSLTALSVSIYSEIRCIKQNSGCTMKPNPQKTTQYIQTARSALSYIGLPFLLTHQYGWVTKNETVITTLEKITSVLSASTQINAVANNFITSFLTTDLSKQDAVSTVVQVEQLKTQLFSLQTNLDLSYRMMQQIVNDPPFPLSLPLSLEKLNQGIETLARIRTDMQTAQRLLLLYPYISGFKQPFTLLILLQNNAEIRPTGGFIGSLMHMTIEDGAVTNMRVEDVYTVDGQLKGHVDPPLPIRDVLQQEHWYLRDSNWNPDFKESAQKAMWFYEKETGETVNGIMAINSSLIVNLLKLTGPVTLLDGGDTISADNFYAKSLQYTQTDFFFFFSKKKELLGNLLSALTTSIFQNKKLSGIQLFETIDQALRERNVQMYFTDSDAQKLATQFEWAGSLPTKQPDCEADAAAVCLFQYLGVIEANLGVNKANYYVKRNDTRDITMNANGKITETLTRILKNTGTNEPGSGVYKNYMRFYIPKTAHITTFTINGQSIPAKATGKNPILTLPYGEFDTTDNPEMTSIAAAFDIPSQQTETISLTYEYQTPAVLTNTTITLAVFTQKQSGIDTLPTLIRIHYPLNWNIQTDDQNTATTLANDGYLEYNSTMSQDSNIQIHFIKE